MTRRIEDLQCEGLKIIQDKNLYTFTSDAVLLANYFKANKGDFVVELCSGSGVISILGTKKTGAQHFYCFEIQKELADMCKASIELNGIKNITVYNENLKDAPSILSGKRIDVVVVNPPYFTDSKYSPNASVAAATHEIKTTLLDILATASKLLKHGGKLYMVQTASRLAEICYTLKKYNLEPKEIVMVKPTTQKEPNVVLLTAVKNGKVGVKIKEKVT